MDKPVVVMMLRDGACAILSDPDNVTVVRLDWDELAGASLGKLCRAYKQIWDLPESLRPGPLNAIVLVVGSRFPIMGEFRPESGPPMTFNATEAILTRGPDYIDNLRDRHYPVGDLAAVLFAQEIRNGPFQVDVDTEAALEFLYADDNEAEAARLYAPDEAP